MTSLGIDLIYFIAVVPKLMVDDRLFETFKIAPFDGPGIGHLIKLKH